MAVVPPQQVGIFAEETPFTTIPSYKDLIPIPVAVDTQQKSQIEFEIFAEETLNTTIPSYKDLIPIPVAVDAQQKRFSSCNCRIVFKLWCRIFTEVSDFLMSCIIFFCASLLE